MSKRVVEVFNETRKNEYKKHLMSKYKESSAERMIILCELFDSYEHKLNKDISEFSKEEIDKCFANLLHKDRSATTYAIRVAAALKGYTDWCLDQGLIKENNFNSFDIKYFVRFANPSKFYTEIDIKGYADYFNNPINVVALATPFYGFTSDNNFEDLFTLKREDVINKYNIVHLRNGSERGDRYVQIPSWLTDNILKAFDSYEYYREERWNRGYDVYEMHGTGLIKSMRRGEKPEDINRKYWMSNKFKRVIQPVTRDETLNYYKIERSGIIYRSTIIGKNNKIKRVIDLFDIKEFQEDVLQRFNIPNINPSQFARRYKGLIKI